MEATEVFLAQCIGFANTDSQSTPLHKSSKRLRLLSSFYIYRALLGKELAWFECQRLTVKYFSLENLRRCWVACCKSFCVSVDRSSCSFSWQRFLVSLHFMRFPPSEDLLDSMHCLLPCWTSEPFLRIYFDWLCLRGWILRKFVAE